MVFGVGAALNARITVLAVAKFSGQRISLIDALPSGFLAFVLLEVCLYLVSHLWLWSDNVVGVGIVVKMEYV